MADYPTSSLPVGLIVSHSALVNEKAGANNAAGQILARSAVLGGIAQDIDSTPPVVANFAPAAASSINAAAAVAFDVTDNIGEHLVQVVTAIHSDGTAEVVWDGAFRGRFAAGSTRTPIANGFHFTMLRSGGWPAAGLTIRVFAIDLDANHVTAIASYTVTNPTNTGDVTPPTVTDFDPAPGVELDSDSAVSFTISDASGAYAGIFVSVAFATGDVETAFQGSSFRGRYGGSARIAVPGGWRFTLRRSGGWQARPTLLIDVVDAKGNVV